MLTAILAVFVAVGACYALALPLAYVAPITRKGGRHD